MNKNYIIRSKLFYNIMQFMIKLYIEYFTIYYDLNDTDHLKIVLENGKIRFKINENDWIKIEDKLPEYKEGATQIVIVSGIENGERYVHYAEIHAYGKEEKAKDIFSIPGWSRMNVTHWMPLPEFLNNNNNNKE